METLIMVVLGAVFFWAFGQFGKSLHEVIHAAVSGEALSKLANERVYALERKVSTLERRLAALEKKDGE